MNYAIFVFSATSITCDSQVTHYGIRNYKKHHKESIFLVLGRSVYFSIFSSPVRIHRKSYCTVPSVGTGVGCGSGSKGISKMFNLFIKVFCAVRRAIL